MKQHLRMVKHWLHGKVTLVHKWERYLTAAVGGSVAFEFHVLEVVTSGALAFVIVVLVFAEESE